MDGASTPKTLGEYAAIISRRRVYFITIIPGVVLAAVFLAFYLTPHYRSTATILLEPSSIPEELIRTTVTDFADEQIEVVSRRVLAADQLVAIVQQIDPYPERKDWTPQKKAEQLASDIGIERVDPITLEVRKLSNAFSLNYDNADPRLAADVAERLATLFLEANRESRSQRAQETYNFLLRQAQSLEEQVRQADEKIAQFKGKHPDSLPGSLQMDRGVYERASRDLQDVGTGIRAAEERRATLSLQLSRLNPSLSATATNPQTELATLQGQLADARIKYTADHPDVKGLQRQIEALLAKQAASPQTAAPAADNPEYIAVRSQLNATERELDSLRSREAQVRSRIYAYESGLAVAPTLEKEFAELARAREVSYAQYSDIQGKLRDADIARSLESEQRGAKFSLIRAPRIPSSPHDPNRAGLILLGILLGASLAAGLAAIAESADETVRGWSDIKTLTQVPLVGSVPIMFNSAGRRARRRWWQAYAAVALIAVSVVAITVWQAK